MESMLKRDSRTFKPVVITIRLETMNEVIAFARRLNLGPASMDSISNGYHDGKKDPKGFIKGKDELWDALDEIIEGKEPPF